MRQISELTPYQEALLCEYKRKWQLASLSTQPIDTQKATQAIKAVYKQISTLEELDIYFFDSPFGIANLSFINCVYPHENWCNTRKLNNLIRQLEKQLLKQGFVSNNFSRTIVFPLIETVARQLDINLWNYLQKQLGFWSIIHSLIPVNLRDSEKSSPIWKSAKSNQQRRLEGLWRFLASGLVAPDTECSICCVLDYCISELQCCPEDNLWHILKTFVTECGWTFFFQDFCFTCNRPFKVLVNEQGQPLCENEALIEFSDGFSVFTKHD